MNVDFSKSTEVTTSPSLGVDFSKEEEVLDTSTIGALKSTTNKLFSTDTLGSIGRGTAALANIPITWPAAGIAGIAKTITSGAEEGSKTVEQIMSLPSQVYLGAEAPKGQTTPVMNFAKGQDTTPEIKALEVIGWPFEKLAELNKYISEGKNDEPPSALRYALGAIPESVLYAGGLGFLGKYGMKAIEAPALSRLSEIRTRGAERAKIPQAAPQAGGPSTLSSAISPAVIGAFGTVSKRQQKLDKAAAVKLERDRLNQTKAADMMKQAKEEETKGLLVIDEEKAPEVKVEDTPQVFKNMPEAELIKQAEYGVQGAKDEVARRGSLVQETAKDRFARENEARIERLKELEKRTDLKASEKRELAKLRTAYENITIKQEKPIEEGVQDVRIQVDKIPDSEIDTYVSRIKSLYDQSGEVETGHIKDGMTKMEKLAVIKEFSEANSTDVGLMEEVFGTTGIGDGGKLQIETPSVQNLNEAAKQEPLTYEELLALNKKGYKVLADTPTPSVTDLAKMTPDQLEVQQRPIKKRIAEHTPNEWRAILNEKPEEMPILSDTQRDRMKTLYTNLEKWDSERQSRIRNIQTLKDFDYSDGEISKMSQSDIEKKAANLRGEGEALGLDDVKIGRLSEIEQKVRAIADEVAGKGIEEYTPEQIDRIEAIYKELVLEDIPGLQPKPSVFDLIDPDTGFTKVSYDQYNKMRGVLQKVIADRQKASAKIAEPTKADIRRRKKDAKLVEKVAEEETFDLEKFNKENPEELAPLDFEEAKRHKTTVEERQLASDKAQRDVIATLRDKRILTNQEARNLRVDAYRYMPKTRTEAVAWLDTIIKAEDVAGRWITSPIRPAFSLKAIAKAKADGLITAKQADLIRTTIRTLKEQPDFDFRIEKDLGQDRAGLYTFAHNMLALKNPRVVAHEVMHFAFHSMLNRADRIAYYKSFIERAYTGEALDMKKIEALTSDKRNAYNPSEVFASRGSDYLNEVVMTPAERSAFTKVMLWFKDLVKSFKQRDYSDVSELFDKVLSKERRLTLEEGLELKGEMPKELSSVEADMLGINSIKDKIADLVKTYQLAKKNTPGKRVLAEVQGQDWGVPWDDTKVIYTKPADKSRLVKGFNMVRNPFRSPYFHELVAGTILEPHVYNLNIAEMYWNHMASQHYTDIRLAEFGGTKSRLTDAEKTRVTTVLRERMDGKPESIQLNPVEQESARLVRDWLDVMRNRYKVHQLDMYKANLNKTEYMALHDIITGATPEQIALKYKRIDLETVKEIAEDYKKIDTWGIDDYIPNVESGKFKILADAVDSNGKAYRKLIGIGLSEKDAIRKATKYIEDNPGSSDLYIDTDFKHLLDETTRVTQKQYGAMIGSLTKQMKASFSNISNEVAKNMASAVVKKKFSIMPTDKFSEFTQPKRDILAGEENIFPVLYTYAKSMEKKMALDPAIHAVRKDLRKMSPEERKYILNFVDDVKGKYGAIDQAWDAFMGSYKGYSAFVGRARTAEAILKLGYRPVAAAVNLASGQMHTMIKVGASHYGKAASFLGTQEGRDFIKSIAPYLGTSLVDVGVKVTGKSSFFHPQSVSEHALSLFQAPEPINREMCVAANYLYALDKGKSIEVASEYAIRANMMQQFTYNVASLPAAMRGPTGKLFMQFKPYLVKELEFMGTLSPKEWAGYLGMQLALGGPRGYLMIARSLPILATMGFWQEITDNAEEWMNKNIPIASRGAAALPGLIKPEYGMDVSAASTFQFPRDMEDFAGPFISDLARLYKDVLVPLSTYGPYVEDMKKGLGVAAIYRHWSRLWELYDTKTGWLKDNKGNNLYQVPDTLPMILQSIAGVENIELNRLRAEEAISNRRDARVEGEKSRLVNLALKHLDEGAPWPQELIDKMGKHGVTKDTLINRLNNQMMPPEVRRARRTDLYRRWEVFQNAPMIEDYDPAQNE